MLPHNYRNILLRKTRSRWPVPSQTKAIPTGKQKHLNFRHEDAMMAIERTELEAAGFSTGFSKLRSYKYKFWKMLPVGSWLCAEI